MAFGAATYASLQQPFSQPIQAGCDDCPSGAVNFGEEQPSYTDPTDLLGDEQISTGFDDQQSEISDSSSIPTTESQGADQDQSNPDSSGNTTQSAAVSQPVPISPAVRSQIRHQVKSTLEANQSGNQLNLEAVLASPGATDYIFQVSDPISTTDQNGQACSLATGDLMRLAAIPGANDTVAQMAVITSGAGSCPAGTTALVSFYDLQEMLNGFAQRLDANVAALRASQASNP